MKPKKNSPIVQNYRIINLVFGLIFASIFLYSLVYSHTEPNHPIPSLYEKFTGETSPSTGLSRSFSALMRGDVKSANSYNPYGIQIFLFFLFQMVFRFISFSLTKRYFSLIKGIILSDLTLTIIAFLLAFKPLIFFTFKLFKNYIVN